MSQEIMQILQQLDTANPDIQLAFQCAPIIAGLKVSNLFVIQKSYMEYVCQLLEASDVLYYIFLQGEEKVTLLLYREKELEHYLKQEKQREFFEKLGYQGNSLMEILEECRSRYQLYSLGQENFPHEIGLVLGYPIEDVEGFLIHKGKHCLYTGYWKVYDNVTEKRRLFQKYETAKETMIRLISCGVSSQDILDIYRRDRLYQTAQ